MRKFLLAALLGGASVIPAHAQSCGDLWYERNAIYKDAGYCFNTPRGIRTFGNAGCQYDNVNDVPLSANSRARIAEIVRMERGYGCR
ncbi:MAG: YARHG domain-containing protein [Rhodoblastus sp.]